MASNPVDRSALGPAQRARALHAARSGCHDVLVIGAGGTGAGCALDAAGRGLSTVLVEAGDFAAGTSSRSGKTFHGGLRYLEQLNFSLVRTALRERDLMVHRLCPYLAKPEPFLYPLTRWWERLYLGAGIGLYDAMTLSRRRSVIPHHRHFGRRATLRHAPSLDPDRVRGGIRYYDVRVDDARHAMTLARTAARLGAQVLRSVTVVDFLIEHGRVCGVMAQDMQSGDRFPIRARTVVSATGIWAGELQQRAGASTLRVTPAKGVHLVFGPDAFDSDTGVFARAEDSVIIIRKWWDHWMLGTTDTAYTGDLRAPRAEPAEVDYLLRNINAYLGRKLTRADIVGTFAGLRPLVAPNGPDPGVTSALLRDHSVLPGPPGLFTVVGGKYTTYRVMAADAIDAAVADLGGTQRSTTTDQPLVGTIGWESTRARSAAIAGRFGLSVATVTRLISRYGALTEQVLAPAGDEPALAAPLPGAAGYLAAEYLYAATHEGAADLEDVLWHRTHVSFETRDGGREVAPHVADLIGPTLGWDVAERATQVENYRGWLDGERAALRVIGATPAQETTNPIAAVRRP